MVSSLAALHLLLCSRGSANLASGTQGQSCVFLSHKDHRHGPPHSQVCAEKPHATNRATSLAPFFFLFFSFLKSQLGAGLCMTGMSYHTVLWTFNLGCQGIEEEEIAFAFSFLKLARV